MGVNCLQTCWSASALPALPLIPVFVFLQNSRRAHKYAWWCTNKTQTKHSNTHTITQKQTHTAQEHLAFARSIIVSAKNDPFIKLSPLNIVESRVWNTVFMTTWGFFWNSLSFVGTFLTCSLMQDPLVAAPYCINRTRHPLPHIHLRWLSGARWIPNQGLRGSKEKPTQLEWWCGPTLFPLTFLNVYYIYVYTCVHIYFFRYFFQTTFTLQTWHVIVWTHLYNTNAGLFHVILLHDRYHVVFGLWPYFVESLTLHLCLTQLRIVSDQDRAADAEVRVIDMTPVKRSAENQVKKVNQLLRVICCLYVCLRVQVASMSISVSVSARITAGNQRI